MRLPWILSCVLLAACSGADTPATSSSSTSTSTTSAPAEGLRPLPPSAEPVDTYTPPPVHKSPNGNYMTRLTLAPQPAPVYQSAKVPARVLPAPGAAPAKGQKPAASNAPDMAALFGARKPAPVANQPVHPAAAIASAAAPRRVVRAQTSPPQKLSFAQCTKQLQGAVSGMPSARLVQNDNTGYAVEMTTPRGIQRAACDPRTNQVVFSVR